jgi:hypothetical protein
VNAIEMGELLAFAALYDNRKVGDPDVIAWLEAIGDLPYPDARSAVAAHYGSESTERIMPGHIRTRVKAMRRERLERNPVAAPPAELADTPVRWRAELAGSLRRIADGLSVPKAIGGPVRGDDPPPTWAEARAKMAAPVVLTPQEKALQQAAESRAARESAGPDEGEPAA